MKATINKIRSGRYTAKHHGYVFMIESDTPNIWTISNNSGVELYRDKTKQSLVMMLSSYGYDSTAKLHQQQFCMYA
jgi:hypothetical protein